MPYMLRAVKLSLKFASATKTAKIMAVLDRYRATVNAYIQHIWVHGGGLNKMTTDVVPLGHLTFRQRSHALHQAIGIVFATRKGAKALGKKATCPVFRGSMLLTKQLAAITLATKSEKFDLWLRLSTLSSGNRIDIPLKATKPFRKWMKQPLAKLKGGCAIGGKPGHLHCIVWVDLPDLPPKQTGQDLGADIGMNKLLVLSNGKQLGKETKAICDEVRRRKPGSKGKRRAQVHRTHYFGEILNSLPWNKLKMIAIEDLKGIKHGKSKKRSKQFRKIVAPWTAAYVLDRIKLKAQEHRVLCVEVDPKYTSQTCPNCGYRASSNRSNEKFKCGQCSHTADADFVGSLNILNRALGSLSSPNLAHS